MLVKIHRNLATFTPEGLTKEGNPKKPYLTLRGPGGSNANIYAGSAGAAALEGFVKNLIKLAPANGAAYVCVDGIRPNDNGIGFVGFVNDLSISPASQEELDWARDLDSTYLRASIQNQMLQKTQGIATEAKNATPVVVPKREVAAPAGHVVDSNDLPF